ncbi:asparagine synthase (glutamine-hydrolyzing) [Brumimicrobium salinarum]|uniref:asparagine synthase (glutamine-hydrolyzing) n=1 Tax=Brumimicrobium salinarum TaxID=2058658 RepID=A0A2I0R613_9FLAO|nr:asparagine synthase (glutamine-hydrolyzing) [Brumimicrobium salinarum]PKR82016.1 asparagine synthase (glutamine-hydrolyzing) [Brumimicrobium salinarum]
MCGITGIVNRRANVKAETLEKMTQSISHRGSDAKSCFLNSTKTCGLGHRRLSIIDLSDSANQPMHSDDRNFSIVYNGELYNFDELKKELVNQNIEFSTDSDTEVVLKSFIHWGPACVERFNGMFAFAIWNEAKEELYLFRDRLGIKPLYYAWHAETFYFASELKAITPFIRKDKWNEKAIQHYFRLGYIPAPLTIYQDVKKLDEGSYLHLEKADLTIHKYWSIESKIEKEVFSDEHQAKKKLHDLLKSSVAYQLKSDVPFGVFLSGGIDSSVIAAVAQSIAKKPISTYSIGFKEATFDESKYAKQIAEKLGTDHHEFIVSHQEVQQLVEEIPTWYDEPFADASALPTFLISKKARQKVKMVLTGDGGDEQFMGYGMYTWADRLTTLKTLRWLIKKVLSVSSKENHNRASQYFNFKEDEHLPSHIFSVDQGFFNTHQLKNNFTFSDTYSPLILEKTKRRLKVSEQQSFHDLKYYLPGDLLTKVDRASMQNQLEARVPLLDHRLVEFSLNLDEKLKRKNGGSKYLLKEVLFEYLSPKLFDRPKWGFGIPLNLWLKQELKPLLDKYVNRELLNEISFYNVTAIMQLKSDYLDGKTYLYNQLWLIIVFNMWYCETSQAEKLTE